MGLETATYISDLVATNPTSSDNASTADDHCRLIKSAVKATFPNVSGAVTPTHTQLNYVTGVTSAIQTQLDAKAAASALNASNLTSGSVPDARVPSSNVTQHQASLTTRNITGKTGTAKTLSASAPSGGSDGDIWYRY